MTNMMILTRQNPQKNLCISRLIRDLWAVLQIAALSSRAPDHTAGVFVGPMLFVEVKFDQRHIYIRDYI